MSAIAGKLTKSPVLEIVVMTALIVITWIGMGLVSDFDVAEDEMEGTTILMWMIGLFLLSYAIALIAVIAQIIL